MASFSRNGWEDSNPIDDDTPNLRPRFNSSHRSQHARSSSPISPSQRNSRNRLDTIETLSNKSHHKDNVIKNHRNFSYCMVLLVAVVGILQVLLLAMYMKAQQIPTNVSFNALTGEWVIPEDSKVVAVSTFNEYPIENEHFKARIAEIKDERSSSPKGVLPELVGKQYCLKQISLNEKNEKYDEQNRCLKQFDKNPVMLLAENKEELNIIKKLFESFKKSDDYEPYIVASKKIMNDEKLLKMFKMKPNEMILDPLYGNWLKLFQNYSPVAVIGIDSDLNELKNSIVEIASKKYKGKSAAIFMDSNDFKYAKWMTKLSPVALASWHIPHFSVSIITNDRPWSLNRLFQSLKSSVFFGDKVPISINVESTADDDTLKLVESFKEKWEARGRVSTAFRVLRAGLIRAVTESYYPNDRHHHCVLLEDDIEVSSLFFAWIKYTTLTYQYGEKSDFAPNMYGVSLYTPRVNEIALKRYKYDSNTVIAFQTGGIKYMPYLHQTPCSWGGVYFPEIWMEFRAYLAARLKEEHITVHIPAARTNWWRTSWKRFFIEMAFQGDYYMLYPNYKNQTSFATNWLEPGQHIIKEESGNNTFVKEQVRKAGDSNHRPQDYTVPLMPLSLSKMLLEQLPKGKLPGLSAIPRMDILDQFVGDNADFKIQILRMIHRVFITIIQFVQNWDFW